MSVDVIGLILVPVTIFVLGGIVALVRGAIRFAQYLVRSEEAQIRSADTLDEISASLNEFKKETLERLGEHDQQLAVLQWELTKGNGSKRAHRPAAEPH